MLQVLWLVLVLVLVRLCRRLRVVLVSFMPSCRLNDEPSGRGVLFVRQSICMVKSGLLAKSKTNRVLENCVETGSFHK